MSSHFRVSCCCLFLILFASLINSSSQQGVIDDLYDSFKCATGIPSVLINCEMTLLDRLDMVKDQIKDKVPPSLFTCCYYAEFSHCLYTETKGSCGRDFSGLISTGVSQIAQMIDGECANYTYESPDCLFVIYFPYIMIAVALLALACVASLCFKLLRC